MDREILENRLVNYAHWYAASEGYRFGYDAKDDVEYMARQAVTKLFGRDVPKRLQPRHRAMMAQAEASLAMMISAMIQGSKEIPGYATNHPNTIGEDTLHFATSRLCPLFPIC